MKTKKRKKQQGAFHKNLEMLTQQRMLSMTILDSEGYIRLLQDSRSGLYLVFNGRFNQSHYSPSYQKAEIFFKTQIELSK